jgi:hypothetical protein
MSEDQPNVDAAMLATRTAAVPGRRKKSILTSRRCVRVVMAISIGISAMLVAVFDSVLVSRGRLMFVTMLIRALLALLVSMFILAVLGVEVQGRQSGDR